jgi:AraC-like DNA-binding protein
VRIVLYDLDAMADEIPDSCRVVAWQPPVPGIAEVFHAHIVEYRYPTHCHDTWTVCILDDGAIGYELDTRHRGAAGRAVTILPPGVPHNGYPAARWGSFRKRNLYLDGAFLPDSFVGPAVDVSTFEDPDLRTEISRLHERLLRPDALDIETRLALIADRFRRHLEPRTAAPHAPEPSLARELRDYLDGHITTTITLAEAAARFERSIPHLVRSFRRQFGISPYAYVTGLRISQARRLLLGGEPPAQVALAVGFHDQAHLTRHFRRHVSVPPGEFAASGVKMPAALGEEPHGRSSGPDTPMRRDS